MTEKHLTSPQYQLPIVKADDDDPAHSFLLLTNKTAWYLGCFRGSVTELSGTQVDR
jgi:hypothetical protein